jgi:hypothetical protein
MTRPAKLILAVVSGAAMEPTEEQSDDEHPVLSS